MMGDGSRVNRRGTKMVGRVEMCDGMTTKQNGNGKKKPTTGQGGKQVFMIIASIINKRDTQNESL